MPNLLDFYFTYKELKPRNSTDADLDYLHFYFTYKELKHLTLNQIAAWLADFYFTYKELKRTHLCPLYIVHKKFLLYL